MAWVPARVPPLHGRGGVGGGPGSEIFLHADVLKLHDRQLNVMEKPQKSRKNA